MLILILIKWRIANYLPRRDKLAKSFAIHNPIMRNEDYEILKIFILMMTCLYGLKMYSICNTLVT